MKSNEQRFNTYQERITENEEDNSSKEEFSILNESFSSKEESEKDSENNEINEKDVSKQWNVNERLTSIKIKLKSIRLIRNREKFITNIIDIFIDINIITFKIIYLNSFRKETTKTKIFIL